MELFNDNSLTTDSNGNVSFSGIRSGINFREAVDSIMEARRIPVDRLETRVEENTSKISALNELGSRLSTLRESVNLLRGAVSVDGSTDVFASKQSYLNATRTDSQTASEATSILGANVTNQAKVGEHQVEVLQRAAAHKFTADTASSKTDDLGTAINGTANSISGNFSINGVTIEVLDTDTLADLRDRINNANSGDNATGVSASIVQVSDTEHVLSLTADDTGTPVSLADDPEGTGDAVLQELGIWDGTNALKHEIQEAQNAKLKADGLTIANALEGGSLSSQSAAIADAGGASTSGTLSLEYTDDGGTTHTFDIDYDTSTDSLQDIARRIDFAAAGSGDTGLQASFVEDSGTYSLQVTAENASAVTVSADTGGLNADFGLANVTDAERVVTRDDNTIDDLFEGATVDLFKAEPGTTVEIGVEQNLNGIKTAITDFVDAYNGVKQYLNAQRNEFALTDQPEEEVGVLATNSALREVETQLTQMLALGAQNVDGTLEVLAQAGIDFVDNDDLSDPARADNLVIDEAKLNDTLLNNIEDIRELFAFSFDSNNPNVSMLSYSDKTQPGSSDYQLYVEHDGTEITAATINGIAGSVSFSGNSLTVTDETGAEGLKLFYNGGATAGTTIDFNVSRGIGANMYGATDNLLDEREGLIENEIDALKSQNENAESNIERLERRLAYQREQLTNQFIRMEEALAEMDTIQKSLQGLIDSMNPSN